MTQLGGIGRMDLGEVGGRVEQCDQNTLYKIVIKELIKERGKGLKKKENVLVWWYIPY